jgi:hypothetical protein
LAKRKSSGGKPKGGKSAGPQSGLGVRRTADGRGWVLVHPRCARDMAEDLAEVREMVEAGELEVAIDELRWLVGSCSEFIEAHALLGELALATNEDVALARGHLGVAVQLGLKTLQRAKVASGPLPYSQPANRPFFEAARGLVWCLGTLKLFDKAEELVATVVKLDPRDPLEVRKVLDDLRTGGLPVVELLGEFGKSKPNDE